jgi:hypothetical protein
MIDTPLTWLDDMVLDKVKGRRIYHQEVFKTDRAFLNYIFSKGVCPFAFMIALKTDCQTTVDVCSVQPIIIRAVNFLHCWSHLRRYTAV